MLNKRKFYINGQWVDPIKSNDCNVINPSTEENCAVISIGSKEDINLAVKSAKDAFNEWAFTSKEEKIKLLETCYTTKLIISIIKSIRITGNIKYIKQPLSI